MEQPRRLGKADLHLHTSASDGVFDVATLLDYVERETDLDVIAITDHDEIAGAHKALELTSKKRYRFEVIAGMEITTLDGHVVGLFLERPVPSLRSLAKTVAAIHAQGGICIVPHPLSWLTRSIGQGMLDEMVRRPAPEVYLDALELVTVNPAARVTFEKAKNLNETRYHLAEVGGSDAHFLLQVGTGYTLFPGFSAWDLRRAILERATRAVSGQPVSLPQIGLRQILSQHTRSLFLLPPRMARRTLARLIKGEAR